MCLLSIIIPIYNKEKFLQDCLSSILDNTFKDFEIICINDGSTDNSLSIVNMFKEKDHRIKVYSQLNKGPASARNLGIAHSDSDYIMFVDADDYIESNTIESCVPYLEDNDLIIFGIKVFGDSFKEKRKTDDEYYKLKFNDKLSINDSFILNTDVSLCNKIFKKSIIKKNNIKFLNGYIYEDANFFFKYISCITNVFFINKLLYNYRRHSDSIMANTFRGEKKAIHHIIIFKDIYRFWKNNGFFESHTNVFITLLKNGFEFAFNFSPRAFKIPVILKTYEIVYSIYKENQNNPNIVLNPFLIRILNRKYITCCRIYNILSRVLNRTFKI